MDFLKEHWSSILVLALILLFTVVAFFVDLEALQKIIESAGIWGPIVYVLAKSSVVIFAPLSGTPLYILSVPVFGFWTGLGYSLLGDFIGATVTFYLSRFFGQPVIKHFTGKKNLKYIESVLDIMSTYKGFISIRFATLTTPEIASYAAGLTKLRFRDFIFIHMLVDLIPVLVMMSPGLVISQKLPAWSGAFIIGGAVIVTVASMIVFVRMVKRKADERSSSEVA